VNLASMRYPRDYDHQRVIVKFTDHAPVVAAD
jgi:hypothetical protein